MTFREYEAAGWRLCSIEPGKKAPVYDGWQKAGFPAESIEALGVGGGLLHALSGTCALDIDDMELARPWLAERNVDIDGLLSEPSAVMISSGRPGRAKLLYRLKKPLRTLKPKGSGLELRCATSDGASVQDVLPPSIHPVTNKPYEWRYGDELIAHWSNLPNIPATLWKAWNDLLLEPVHLVEAKVQEKPIETVRKAINNYIASRKLDVTDYAQWLDVGMRLHKQTGGAEEGLIVWNEWSRTDTSKSASGKPRYQGYLALKEKWLTFVKDDQGGVGMEGIIRELPAEADEFPEEPVEAKPSADDTAALLLAAAGAKRKDVMALIEKRLIYVANTEKYFDTQRHRVIQTESGLEHMFTPLMWKVKGGGRASPAKELKASSTKTVVDYLGFHPGAGLIFTEDGETYANTYRDRLPEPVEPTADELAIIHWLFDRIDDPVFREYYRQFLGHIVQRPGVKIKSAPLIWSDTQGNGKTTLVRTIPSLLVGKQYSKEITCTQLSDGFTGYLLDTWHVNLTEFRAGSKGEREAISKKVESWIAEDMVTVRPMHAVAHTIPNRFFVTGSSNAEDAAAISNQDRKWAIHEMKAPPFSPEEQEWVYGFLGRTRHASAVLRSYFLNVDLTGFRAAARAPESVAKAEMAAANISSDVEALTLMFEQREPPFDRDVVLTGEVTQAIHRLVSSKPTANRVGKILTRAPFNGVAFRFRAGAGIYRAIALRNSGHWRGSPGSAVMAHIQGNDVDVTDPLLT